MPAALSRRRALAGLALPLAALPAVAAAPQQDAPLLTLLHRFTRAQDATGVALDAWVAAGEPTSGKLDQEMTDCMAKADAVVARMAETPADGSLGLAIKAGLVAYALLHGGGEAEETLADSLLLDLDRLLPFVVPWRADMVRA